jgi:hypothetical protein
VRIVAQHASVAVPRSRPHLCGGVVTVLGGVRGLLPGLALLILYILMPSVSAVQGIFDAAVYRYACFKKVPPAFDADLVKFIWTVKT